MSEEVDYRERAERALRTIDQRAVDHVVDLIMSASLDPDVQWGVAQRVRQLGPAHPVVAEYVAVFVQQEILRNDLARLSKRMPKLKPNDDPGAPETEPHDRAKQFMDDGHVGGSWRPSQMFDIGRIALRTSWMADRSVSRRSARRKADHFEQWALTTARERWKNGFYADPFDNVPTERTASTTIAFDVGEG